MNYPEHSSTKIYMQRCIELARNGLGNVAPNPMVGCVIVSNGKIIGEGYHRKYGEAHAEVNAISSVKDKENLKTATLYVNLEPCCYHGKTPPCTDLIIRHKIPKVVIGCTDPAPKVSGKGIEQLKGAGCKVTHGILERECKELNRRFFTFNEKKRPYIMLKWAQTMDGFIAQQPPSNSPARAGGELLHTRPPTLFGERAEAQNSNRISNELSHTLVHKWRSEEQAIMVGTNTAHIDNPQLDVREWSGKDPLRIVLDKTLRLSKGLYLFDRSIPTIVFTSCKIKSEKNLEYVNIDFKKNIIPQILEELYRREIQSIIIEGGTQLLHSFIKNEMWDEMRIFIGNKKFGNGINAPELPVPPIAPPRPSPKGGRANARKAPPQKAQAQSNEWRGISPAHINSNIESKKEDIGGDELLIFRNKQ